MVQSHDGLLLSEKKEGEPDTCWNTEEAWLRTLSDRSHGKSPRAVQCVSTKCPEQANSWGQKIDGRWPEAGGGGARGVTANGYVVSFWGEENVWTSQLCDFSK